MGEGKYKHAQRATLAVRYAINKFQPGVGFGSISTIHCSLFVNFVAVTHEKYVLTWNDRV